MEAGSQANSATGTLARFIIDPISLDKWRLTPSPMAEIGTF